MLNARQKRQVYAAMREYAAKLLPVIDKWEDALRYMPLAPETECMTYLAAVNSLALYDILHTPEDVYDLLSRILVFMNRDGYTAEVADQKLMDHYMDINKEIFKSLSNKFRRYEVYVNEVVSLFASKCFKAPSEAAPAQEDELRRNSVIMLDDARPVIREYIRGLVEKVGRNPERRIEGLDQEKKDALSKIIVHHANMLYDTIIEYHGADKLFVSDPYTICFEFAYVIAGEIFQERCNDDPKLIQDLLAEVFAGMPSEEQEGNDPEEMKRYFDSFYPYMLDDLNAFMVDDGEVESREVVKSIYSYAAGSPDTVYELIEKGDKPLAQACSRAAAVVTKYVYELNEYCDDLPALEITKTWNQEIEPTGEMA